MFKSYFIPYVPDNVDSLYEMQYKDNWDNFLWDAIFKMLTVIQFIAHLLHSSHGVNTSNKVDKKLKKNGTDIRYYAFKIK